MANTTADFITDDADEDDVYAYAAAIGAFDDSSASDEDDDSDVEDDSDDDSDPEGDWEDSDEDDASEEDDPPHFEVQDYVEANLTDGRVELPDGTDMLEAFVQHKGFEVRESQFTVVDETLERFFDADACERDGIFDGSLSQGVDMQINAPVATGKSAAAVLIGIGSGQRTVLASSNKSLQAQYMSKDIPEIAEFLRSEYDYELTFSIMKGQYNYANLLNLKAALDGSSEFEVFQDMADSTRSLIEDIVAESELGIEQVRETGRASEHLDVGHLIEQLPKQMRRLSSAASPGAKKGGLAHWANLLSMSPSEMTEEPLIDVVDRLTTKLRAGELPIAVEESPYLTAYFCASVADIVVVNQNLLVADLIRSQNSRSEAANYLTPSLVRGAGWIIVDEAQHYPAILTSALSKEFSLGHYADDVDRVSSRLDKAGFGDSWITGTVDRMTDLIEDAHDDIRDCLEEQDDGSMIADADVVISTLYRLRTDLVEEQDKLRRATSGALADVLSKNRAADKKAGGGMEALGIAAATKEVSSKDSKVAKAWSRSVSEIEEAVLNPLAEFNPSDMWSVTTTRDTTQRGGEHGDADVDYVVHLTPLNIRTHRGQMLEVQQKPNIFSLVLGQKAWNGIFGTGMALMSGTLSKLVGPKIGMASENGEYLSVESPMDCRHVRYCVPGDLPSPSGQTYGKWRTEATARVVEMVKTMKGRALVLCTSTSTMNEFAAAIRKKVPEVRAIVQNEMDKKAAIELFKIESNAVLLGVKSFWEGVDIPGDDLLLVIMDKIMFPIKDDHVYGALSEAEEMAGGDPFINVTVDHASFMFAQGAGRLQRTETDKGGVLILDPRINDMRYGSRVTSLAPEDSPFTKNYARFSKYMTRLRDAVDSGEKRPGFVKVTEDGENNWVRLGDAGPKGSARKRRSGGGKRRFD